jgi:hypothetical protein
VTATWSWYPGPVRCVDCETTHEGPFQSKLFGWENGPLCKSYERQSEIFVYFDELIPLNETSLEAQVFVPGESVAIADGYENTCTRCGLRRQFPRLRFRLEQRLADDRRRAKLVGKTVWRATFLDVEWWVPRTIADARAIDLIHSEVIRSCCGIDHGFLELDHRERRRRLVAGWQQRSQGEAPRS